jgi:hypothetical protein
MITPHEPCFMRLDTPRAVHPQQVMRGAGRVDLLSAVAAGHDALTPARTTGGTDMEGSEEELGPIDVVVIGYPAGAPMTGEAVPLLLDLVDKGIIRVLDALIVRKEEDGTFSGLDLSKLDESDVGDLTAFAGASTGLLGDDDAALAAAEIEPGSAAAMIVYENRWAASFIAAVRRNGGELIANQRIGVEELMAALEASEDAA